MKFNPNDPKYWADYDPTEENNKREFVDHKSETRVKKGRANRIKAKSAEWLQRNLEAQVQGGESRAANAEWHVSLSKAAAIRSMTAEAERTRAKATAASTDNPEWRQKKSQETSERLSDPSANSQYKGAVVGTNIETGKQIMLNGSTAIRAAGFNTSDIARCVRGDQAQHKGYTWVRIAAPKKVTVAVSVTTGERIVFYSSKEIREAKFNTSVVANCIKGKFVQHKGYTWHHEFIDQEYVCFPNSY